MAPSVPSDSEIVEAWGVTCLAPSPNARLSLSWAWDLAVRLRQPRVHPEVTLPCDMVPDDIKCMQVRDVPGSQAPSVAVTALLTEPRSAGLAFWVGQPPAPLLGSWVDVIPGHPAPDGVSCPW